jgi:hypothetical protein
MSRPVPGQHLRPVPAHTPHHLFYDNGTFLTQVGLA